MNSKFLTANPSSNQFSMTQDYELQWLPRLLEKKLIFKHPNRAVGEIGTAGYVHLSAPPSFSMTVQPRSICSHSRLCDSSRLSDGSAMMVGLTRSTAGKAHLTRSDQITAEDAGDEEVKSLAETGRPHAQAPDGEAVTATSASWLARRRPTRKAVVGNCEANLQLRPARHHAGEVFASKRLAGPAQDCCRACQIGGEVTSALSLGMLPEITQVWCKLNESPYLATQLAIHPLRGSSRQSHG